MQYQAPMSYWPAIEPFALNIVLKNSGLHLHVYDTGPAEAPTILMVHGLGDESDTWRHIIHPLSIHQRVIAPDLPGFGRSEALKHYTITAYIRTLVDLLDTLDISNAVLMGSSLGGIICHALATMKPERVKALVLLDGHLGMENQKINLGTLLLMLPGIGEWRYNHYRKNPQAAYKSLQPFYASLEQLPKEDREFLFQRVNERVWSNSQRKAYLSVLRNTASWLAKNQRKLDKSLEHLDIPTLVIYGGDDSIIPLANADALSKLQPSSRLVILPGVGHLPHQEASELLLLTLKNDPALPLKL
jgi:pimeloyl-ACP methyl ester carboxylesterase